MKQNLTSLPDASPASGGEWRPIESAPKDGTCVLLLSKEYTDPADVNGGPYHRWPKCAIGRWDPEGDSWCDENGLYTDDPKVNDDTISLHITGSWLSGGGWFQPNEVTHWQPLPAPPGATPAPSVTEEQVAKATAFLAKVHEVLSRRFPRCRDCADDGPTCPNSGLPCDLYAAFGDVLALIRGKGTGV